MTTERYKISRLSPFRQVGTGLTGGWRPSGLRGALAPSQTMRPKCGFILRDARSALLRMRRQNSGSPDVQASLSAFACRATQGTRLVPRDVCCDLWRSSRNDCHLWIDIPPLEKIGIDNACICSWPDAWQAGLQLPGIQRDNRMVAQSEVAARAARSMLDGAPCSQSFRWPRRPNRPRPMHHRARRRPLGARTGRRRPGSPHSPAPRPRPERGQPASPPAR